jgi:hypothetical protein
MENSQGMVRSASRSLGGRSAKYARVIVEFPIGVGVIHDEIGAIANVFVHCGSRLTDDGE